MSTDTHCPAYIPLSYSMHPVVQELWVSSFSCMRSFLTFNGECVYMYALPIILYQPVKNFKDRVCASYHTISTCKKKFKISYVCFLSFCIYL